MPSREEHLATDRRLFRGLEFPEVHRILDQFSHFPDGWFLERHRQFLHHEEGIAYLEHRFGTQAGASARQHVLDDCGHVPRMRDYQLGIVNEYGDPMNPHARFLIARELRLIADAMEKEP